MLVQFFKWNGSIWVYKGNTSHFPEIGSHVDVPGYNTQLDFTYPIKTMWGTGSYRVRAIAWYGTDDDGNRDLGAGSDYSINIS